MVWQLYKTLLRQGEASSLKRKAKKLRGFAKEEEKLLTKPRKIVPKVL
jgi:hypothetical protein